MSEIGSRYWFCWDFANFKSKIPERASLLCAEVTSHGTCAPLPAPFCSRELFAVSFLLETGFIGLPCSLEVNFGGRFPFVEKVRQ